MAKVLFAEKTLRFVFTESRQDSDWTIHLWQNVKDMDQSVGEAFLASLNLKGLFSLPFKNIIF